MRIAIVRPVPEFSLSMDVYANGLVEGLRQVRPDWQIEEFSPQPAIARQNFWQRGLHKYVQRYWHFPQQLIRQRHIDVFHIVDHSDGHLLYSLHRAGRRTAIVCHDLINLVRPEFFQDRARLPSISMTVWQHAIRGLKLADRILAVSEHTAGDVVRELGVTRDRITVIPNAVETMFRPISPEAALAHRRDRGVAPETICLLNVGSNNQRKNIETILKAVDTLHRQTVPVQFWKTGADFTPGQKEFIRDRRLDSCVAYLGKPDRDCLIQTFNAADVVVSPSFYEGFGLTVLEAMACGTPVIAANVTSLPEVTGDAGILVDPMDADAIATAARDLKNNPAKRQALVARGLARSRQFTWQRTAEAVARVYEDILAQQGGIKRVLSSV